jgi:hypothetical protein
VAIVARKNKSTKSPQLGAFVQECHKTNARLVILYCAGKLIETEAKVYNLKNGVDVLGKEIEELTEAFSQDWDNNGRVVSISVFSAPYEPMGGPPLYYLEAQEWARFQNRFHQMTEQEVFSPLRTD